MHVAVLHDFLDARWPRERRRRAVSVHLKATMLSLGIRSFGHVVQAFFAECLPLRAPTWQPPGPHCEQRARLDPRRSGRPPERCRDPRGVRRRVRRRSGDAWSTPTSASLPSPHQRPLNRVTPRCRRDPHFGPHVGAGRTKADTLAVTRTRATPSSTNCDLRRPCTRRRTTRPRLLGAQRRLMARLPKRGLLTRQDVRDRDGMAPSRSRTPLATSCLEHAVAAVEHRRMCQTKDVPVRDWVKRRVPRASDWRARGVSCLRDARA